MQVKDVLHAEILHIFLPRRAKTHTHRLGCKIKGSGVFLLPLYFLFDIPDCHTAGEDEDTFLPHTHAHTSAKNTDKHEHIPNTKDTHTNTQKGKATHIITPLCTCTYTAHTHTHKRENTQMHTKYTYAWTKYQHTHARTQNTKHSHTSNSKHVQSLGVH